jgi:hypothetical protein
VRSGLPDEMEVWVTSKNREKPAKIGKNGIKSQENCGNRGFSIDFIPAKAAL